MLRATHLVGTLAALALAIHATSALAQTAPPGGQGGAGRPAQRPPTGAPGQPGANAAQPAPVTVEPALQDFGLVDPGVALPGVFKVTNAGSAPLQIVAMLPSCKCTTTDDYIGRTIAPGETLEMKATMNAPTTPGVKEAKVNVVFQGFSKPTLLHLKCDVRLSIRAVEELVDALKGVTSGTLTIESRDGQPFSIISSNGEKPSFVGFDPAKDAPRNSYKINWSVEGWPCEGMRLWWIIETDRKDCPILPCRIRHECSGVKADPTYKQRKWMFKEPLVVAGKVKAGKPTIVKAEVENSEPKAGPQRPATFSTAYKEITAVQSISPGATSKLASLQPRGVDEAILNIEFTPKEGTSGLVYHMVRVTGPTGSGDIAIVAVVEP